MNRTVASMPLAAAVMIACLLAACERGKEEEQRKAAEAQRAALEAKQAELADKKQELSAADPEAARSQLGAALKAKRKARGQRMIRPAPRPDLNTEDYAQVDENEFELATHSPLSTFSVDTDTASYSNVRRFLKKGNRPPKGAVRIEEMVNYFSYAYPAPAGAHPFSAHVEIAACPWNADHQLARIGLRGKSVANVDRKPANLVFLLDVSGSMGRPNKLPLLKRSLRLAVNQLNAKDRVAIVVYAGASGLVLPSTSFDDRQRILGALDALEAGGSTNAGQGIELAYKVAKENFIAGGSNRVILATDGDFNVGLTDKTGLVDLVQKRAKDGVFLTVLGFGMGNLKDDMLEKLADKGNGSYAYIDDFAEARKVFGEQISGTLETIAKDVKIQVEFNPNKVQAYRLVGYENRKLAAKDFNDDTKDAGEIGAGHTVTAFYEIVPPGKPIGVGAPKVDDLKYQKPAEKTVAAHGSEIMTVKIRYKPPQGDTSTLAQFAVKAGGGPFAAASGDFRFAASVAGFGMLLKDSKFKGKMTYEQIRRVGARRQGRRPPRAPRGVHRAGDRRQDRKGRGHEGREGLRLPAGGSLCSCF